MLTTVVRRDAETIDVSELEFKLTSASLDLADRLIHSAFREMEAAMFEQVSKRLREELPGIIAKVLAEEFLQARARSSASDPGGPARNDS